MACVEKIKCDDCGSSDGKQVFYNEESDSYSSFCFAECNTYKGNPYKDGEAPKVKIKTPEEILQEIQEVQECKLLDKATRGIPAKEFKQWGVRLILSEHDGKTPYAVGFGYTDEGKLSGWKISTLGRKCFYSVGATKNADPFGFERALKVGGRRLYITEGEWDAISLHYCLKEAQKNTKYAKQNYAVISLPAGAGSVSKALQKIRTRIKGTFKEVVVCFDADLCGAKAEKDVQKLIPQVLRVDKPQGCKDANDAVKKKMVYEMAKNALFNAHKPPIKGVIQVSDVLSRVIEKPTMGLSYPMEELTELTYGQRFGECVAVGGGTGSGKTLLAHEWSAHNMMVHDMPCFMVLLEEQNASTVRNIAGKIDSIPYHNPKIEYDNDQFMSTIDSLQGKLMMWESDEDQTLRFELDEIITAIRFNVAEYGVKFVYIDNMTRLVDHLSSSEANEFINRYSSELEGLSTQLDIHIDVFSHVNAPKFGPSHEEGAAIFPNQFTGSKGMMRSFPVMMGFERNKYAPDGLASRSFTSVIKNRKFGGEGKVKTLYNPSTSRLNESAWEGDAIIIEDENSKKKRR
jgi:twinkle protein